MGGGIGITVTLNASQAEAKYRSIRAQMEAGQVGMSTAAERSSVRQIAAMDAEIAKAEEGTAAFGAMVAERAKMMAKFTAIAEKNESAAILKAQKAGSAQVQADQAAILKAQKSGAAQLMAEQEAKAAAIKLELAAAAAADAAAIERETLALRGQAASAAALRVEEAARQKQLEADIALEMAAAEAAEFDAVKRETLALRGAAARAAETRAEEELGAATGKTNTILGQFMVIIKDLIRGQWSRGGSTLLTLLQNIGISLTGILTGAGLLVLVGVAIHSISKAFREMADGVQTAADKLDLLKTRLESTSRAASGLVKSREEFAKWLKKFDEGGRDNSLTKRTEDYVAALRKQFEMEQKVAKAKGQSPEQGMKAQQEENRKEAAVFSAAADEAERIQAEHRKAAVEAEGRNAPIISQREADLGVQQKEAAEARDRLAGVLSQFGEQTSGSAIARAWRSNNMASLGTSFGNKADQMVSFKYQGEDVVKSLNQAKNEYAAAEAAVAKTEAELQKRKDEVAGTQEDADEARRDAEALREKAQSSKETAEEVGDVDTTGAGARPKLEGLLTSNQRIGAFAGASVSLVDVNKGIARDVKAIHAHITRGSAGGTGASREIEGFD